ncbi:MAG: efflux RND transporter periplasmic adaptor subunit [Nitrospiraceae bacterium]|nr:efflux RND transporter periplasmic adaptor subunit [Nitrospiraceae bacterium]
MNSSYQIIRKIACRLILALFVLFADSGIFFPAWAHGGEKTPVNGENGGSDRPVHLSPKQQKILGLSLASASYRRMKEVLVLNGTVRWLPDRQSDVTLRISGQVTSVYVSLGERVHKGQRMVKVESRLIGNPPPSVVITAPLRGVVDVRNIVLGQAVEPNTVLFHIGNPTQMLVVARVYEEDFDKVRFGQEAEIRVLGYPGQVFRGRVTLVGPRLNPKNRTGSVWIQVSNPKGLLKPNMFARVKLIVKQAKKVLVVPDAALLLANGKKFVFVSAGPGSYRRILVQTGMKMDGFTEVLSGLSPGQKVVTRGNREIYTMWLGTGFLKAED